ncbi:hypothetical protein [Streptomyces sp. NPDC059909]|uniref:hypothetical protein n=1 Tax=Streptomyces sp. NPDC059909 TaxID=3346998 RepID=UPI003661B920
MRRMPLPAAALAAALLTACGPTTDDAAPSKATASPSAATTSALPLPASPPPSPMSTTPAPETSGPSATAAKPAGKPAPPARPTVVAMYASTAGGRIDLVRDGAAKEFTVHVHNGNTRAYSEIAVDFQMEIMESTGEGPAPAQNGFVLERRNPATGRWTRVELRVANDVQPHWLTPAGTPLARDAARVERFRLRAVARGPIGSTPLMIKLVDTAAPQDATFETAFPARTSLMVSAGR